MTKIFDMEQEVSSPGLDLANQLWESLTDEQRWFAERACPELELEGFLIGLFWNQHSRVALRNAAGYMYQFRSK